ncbi:zinc-finger homeodomain protein 4-like [Prosopis cineraria]|uniref:zinc-finger homeodomain protein 4-like n=1 Tax=Prosopis cineraria TaxID=364024 RepID=UPI00240EF433|nr:zinc-finger homeodomain protein 4-like [Prosopis cineraria]
MESRIVHTTDHHKRPSVVEELGPEEKKKKKTIIKYKECLKNHAASMGGHATDGCGEFMAEGEEGTPDSLKCSACKCHRNFHRKHFEAEDSDDNSPSSLHYDYHPHPHHLLLYSQKLPDHDGADDHQVMKPLLINDLCLGSYNNKSGSNASSDRESDEKRVMTRKRFRTKFSEEQKEKMLRFAEKVGWRMQKGDESMVQQFCEELGIKRRVLKVWMHNNKNTFSKRNLIISST